MNIHKNARLTLLRRIQMVKDMTERGLSATAAADAYGVTAPTARKWLSRHLAQGTAGLSDASSRPNCSPRAISPAKALAIVELRHKRLTHARIAAALGVSCSTVGRVLACAGLSRLSDLQPAEPVLRYEHAAPGGMLHIDTKKLGRIERPSPASLATGATRSMVQAGRRCSWPSTTMPALPSPPCIRTRKRPKRCSSCTTQSPTAAAWA